MLNRFSTTFCVGYPHFPNIFHSNRFKMVAMALNEISPLKSLF